MTITELLNSGKLHSAERLRRADCVDARGAIHGTPERARFRDWVERERAIHGENVKAWPADMRAEYEARHVPA